MSCLAVPDNNTNKRMIIKTERMQRQEGSAKERISK